jgi:hypothetical protein
MVNRACKFQIPGPRIAVLPILCSASAVCRCGTRAWIRRSSDGSRFLWSRCIEVRKQHLIAMGEKLEVTVSSFRGAQHLLITVFCNSIQQRLERFQSRCVRKVPVVDFVLQAHDDRTGMCDQGNRVWLFTLAVLLSSAQQATSIVKRLDCSAASISRSCSLRNDCAS